MGISTEQSNPLFRQLSKFRMVKSNQASNHWLAPECPLSPRSVGSFWSDSESEDEDEEEGEDSVAGASAPGLVGRQKRLESRGSESTLASEGSSIYGSREGPTGSRQSARSSTTTLRSESRGSLKAVMPVFPVQNALSVESPPALEEEEEARNHISMTQLSRPARPPLKAHSSFPVPSPPLLPDVFLDASGKHITAGQSASPWSLGPPGPRHHGSELERRRSWQSPPTKIADTLPRRPHLLRQQGPTVSQERERQDNSQSRRVESSTAFEAQSTQRECKTTGPSFASRFGSSAQNPATPETEQRERIARLAAQVVSTFSPSCGPESNTAPGSPAVPTPVGLGLDVDHESDLLSPSTSSSRGASATNWTSPWVSDTRAADFPATSSWKACKRTSVPPPARQEGGVSRTAYNTPLILQKNSPSLHLSPALGATAQSCWSAIPESSSPWSGRQSPFAQSAEDIAVSSPSLLPTSASPALARRPSLVSQKRSSF
ncbi:unnamed protein product [Sympodiomycopsis kandeliae]